MLNIIKYDNANALEATWLDADSKQIASIAYADTQIDLLRTDVAKYGGDITPFESLIAEVEANIQPPPQLTAEQRKTIKQLEIDAIEASQYMTRGEREGWIAMIEAQATAQSVTLDVLYAANPFYKKLKDVDTAVSALRAELKAIV